jgi:hypothetical protein
MSNQAAGKCPVCGAIVTVPSMASSAVCPLCGTVVGLSTQAVNYSDNTKGLEKTAESLDGMMEKEGV